MNTFKDEKLVSLDSKVTCKDLQNITRGVISLTVYSKAETLEVVRLCRNRNEAMINRDVTPLIVPPVKSFYLKDGAKQFEHFTDEVNSQWHRLKMNYEFVTALLYTPGGGCRNTLATVVEPNRRKPKIKQVNTSIIR